MKSRRLSVAIVVIFMRSAMATMEASTKPSLMSAWPRISSTRAGSRSGRARLLELTGDDRIEKRGFGLGAKIALELPCGLHDDGRRYEQLARVAVESVDCRSVLGVVGVDRAQQDAGIDQDGHRLFRSSGRCDRPFPRRGSRGAGERDRCGRSDRSQ